MQTVKNGLKRTEIKLMRKCKGKDLARLDNIAQPQKKVEHWSPDDIMLLMILSVSGLKRSNISDILNRAGELVFSKL